MKLKYIFVFFLILLVAYFSYIVLSSIVSQNISVNLLVYSIGKLAGLIGFLSLSILIISGDTARFFDRFFGMDKIIKFQRKFSLITTFFVVLHPIFFVLSDKIYLNYIIPDFAVIPMALGAISLYILLIVMVCSLLYKRISYKKWQYIHILTYVLFFFSLYHALKAGSDTSNPVMKFILGIFLAGVIWGMAYRTYYKIKNRGFKCYVREIVWETPNVFTLKLKTSKKLFFKPGQFCFLRLNKEKLYARHPFTISSSADENTLDFTMKITGRFTKIASQLKEGEEIIVDGPFGIFTINNKEKNLVFIAGGVGITPFRSIIKNQLGIGKNQKITLLYGAKTKEDIVFKKELDNINDEWFKKVYILSKEEKSSNSWKKGYITKQIIEEKVSDIKNSVFYICGPESMKDNIVKMLRGLNVKKENIRIESFFW